MASPLAELVLREAEAKVLNGLRKEMKFYLRYVDDVVTVWSRESDPGTLEKGLSLKPYGLVLKQQQSSQTTMHFLDKYKSN